MKKLPLICLVVCFSAAAFMSADAKTPHVSMVTNKILDVSIPLEGVFHKADLMLSPNMGRDIPVAEVEPNDDLLTNAQDLGTGVDSDPFVVSGSIAASDDVDYYQFTLPEGGCVDFTLDFNCDFDYDLDLFFFDPDDQTWYWVAYSWFACPEVISGWAAEGGLWALKVVAYEGNVGDYTLTVFWELGVDADEDGWFVCLGDCDDTDGTVYPGADEICDDQVDNDCDGLVDMDDPDCACTEPDFAANCGDVVAGDTTGGTDDISSYSCSGWDESGPEDIYTVNVDEQYLVVEITDLVGDLDIFVLSDDPNGVCSGNCVAYGDSVAIFEVTASGDYHVAVDGYSGAEGPYTLEIICCHDNDGDGFLDEACGGSWGVDCDDDDYDVNPGVFEDCYDGIDNDCDGLVDMDDTECCEIECPPEGLDEAEPCGEDTNGGCNSDPPVFTDINCGDTFCAEAWADDGSRDTDWYEVVIGTATTLTWTVEADFPFVIGIVETDPPGSGDCANSTGYLDPYEVGDACAEIFIEAALDPGTYWFFVAPLVFEGLPCEAPGEYVATLECECWDNDGDGYDDEACGGDDCDDADASVNPGAVESKDAGNCADGIDNDCDGLIDTDPECKGCFIQTIF